MSSYCEAAQLGGYRQCGERRGRVADALTQVGIALQQPTLPWASAIDTDTHARTSSRRHVQHCWHAHASILTPSLWPVFCFGHLSCGLSACWVLLREVMDAGPFVEDTSWESTWLRNVTTGHGRFGIAPSFQSKFLFCSAVYVCIHPSFSWSVPPQARCPLLPPETHSSLLCSW